MKLYSVIPLLSILFIGDSITHGWDAHKQILEKPNIIIDGTDGASSIVIANKIKSIIKDKPYKIFIMMGINNVESDQVIINNYINVLKIINKESPGTFVYIQSILPVDVNHISNNQIENINSKLREICKNWNDPHITFIDLYSYFIDPATKKLSKNFTNDGLHLARNGYSLWKRLILTHLQGNSI